MLLRTETVHRLLTHLLAEWDSDGHDVSALRTRLADAGADLDELTDIAESLAATLHRDDWPWREPDGLDEIISASTGDWTTVLAPAPDVTARIRTGFLGRVAGCILGKPLELGLSRGELQPCLKAAGCWPLDDYIPESALDHLPERQPQWEELVRERITHVAVDDDLNYTALAMLALEQHGDAITHEDLAQLWRLNLPIAATFGPERARIAVEATSSLLAMAAIDGPLLAEMPLPGADLCGALIRADAYGYACPGEPGRAARLAHLDATFTHHRTGVYGSMWVAAALALAATGMSALDAAAGALGFVPTTSRFHAAVSLALDAVASCDNWSDANDRVVAAYPEHGHCRILQEVGTLIVTFRFARDVGDGICLQVMQGNDTDSFGATAGSILGVAMGADSLDPRWIEPFNDTMPIAMAMFETPSLSSLADRMAALAARPRGITGSA